ncbi:MAG: relaxase/mobilization nuclease domain-containing protein, partial [Alphaproteobacteria bacterium]
MIAKRILREGTSSFKRLSDYITDAKKSAREQVETEKRITGEETEIWERTVEYILDAAAGGERVGAIRISNCLTTEVDLAVLEILSTQNRNTRAKAERTYHMVVSFPPGETPADEQLHDIEDELVNAIGLGEHQRISALHTDTDHLHMHVAINQIHPQNLRRIEPYYDKLKLMEACERLEIKHDLIRTYHGETKAAKTDRRPEGRAEAMDAHGARPSMLGWIRREVRPALLSVLNDAGGWQDIHAAMAEYGLVLRRRGAGVVIAEMSDSRITVKASSVDRALGLQTLEKRFGSFISPNAEVINKAGKAKHTYGRAKVHRDKDLNQLFEEW